MWTKICGIRDAETARVAASSGADAIGLNFYAGSPRSVGREAGAGIVAGLPAATEPVGVFVNHSVAEVVGTARQCGLRAVQLHGDEPPHVFVELRDALPGVKLIRAWRLGEEGTAPLAAFLDELQALGVELFACLIDARVDGVYGGSGRTAPWERLAGGWPADWPRLILAGGLTAGNVGQAIRSVGPWGVDVASGVEAAPGVKDPELVRRFLAAVRTSGFPA